VGILPANTAAAAAASAAVGFKIQQDLN